jgi:hypothetical protein
MFPPLLLTRILSAFFTLWVFLYPWHDETPSYHAETRHGVPRMIEIIDKGAQVVHFVTSNPEKCTKKERKPVCFRPDNTRSVSLCCWLCLNIN